MLVGSRPVPAEVHVVLREQLVRFAQRRVQGERPFGGVLHRRERLPRLHAPVARAEREIRTGKPSVCQREAGITPDRLLKTGDALSDGALSLSRDVVAAFRVQSHSL